MAITGTYKAAIQTAAAAFMLLILAAYAVSPAGAAAPAQNAETFLEDLAASSLTMLNDGDYSESERAKKFREMVRKGFALDRIGRFVVGRHWRQMNADQQADYQELFSEWILASYAGRLGGFAGQTLEIVKSIELQNKKNDVVVRTRLLMAHGEPPIKADWRVRNIGGEPRIIDIVVEDVSMVTAQKAEFDAVIRKIGIEGLLDSLRMRLTTMVAGTE